MKKLIIILFAFIALAANTQPVKYTTSNAHSHNDYEQPVPYYSAYNAGFGSIEADIFLIKGKLLVAHDMAELQKNRSLEDWYLKPLDSIVHKNHGYPYTVKHKKLQMMIDIKSGAVNTLDALTALLKQYRSLINSTNIQWVISGSRPADTAFVSYPAFIWFDGILSKTYAPKVLPKIVMMSDDFKTFSHWNGEGELPVADKAKLTELITKAHAQGKTVRFWDAPDVPNAWHTFMQLGVDYINTDKIEELRAYMNMPN